MGWSLCRSPSAVCPLQPCPEPQGDALMGDPGQHHWSQHPSKVPGSQGEGFTAWSLNGISEQLPVYQLNCEES